MNNTKYMNYLLKLNDFELEREEQEIYDDCVVYNDCSICPHKFCDGFDGEFCSCKLDTITLFKKNRNKEI